MRMKFPSGRNFRFLAAGLALAAASMVALAFREFPLSIDAYSAGLMAPLLMGFAMMALGLGLFVEIVLVLSVSSILFGIGSLAAWAVMLANGGANLPFVALAVLAVVGGFVFMESQR